MFVYPNAVNKIGGDKALVVSLVNKPSAPFTPSPPYLRFNAAFASSIFELYGLQQLLVSQSSTSMDLIVLMTHRPNSIHDKKNHTFSRNRHSDSCNFSAPKNPWRQNPSTPKPKHTPPPNLLSPFPQTPTSPSSPSSSNPPSLSQTTLLRRLRHCRNPNLPPAQILSLQAGSHLAQPQHQEKRRRPHLHPQLHPLPHLLLISFFSVDVIDAIPTSCSPQYTPFASS
ncbi:hypothetical protein GBA52_010086 [Prunus armeniaca]|nr:hypothetical protein GBA52_010086 [Prunus armeniaca]